MDVKNDDFLFCFKSKRLLPIKNFWGIEKIVDTLFLSFYLGNTKEAELINLFPAGDGHPPSAPNF